MHVKSTPPSYRMQLGVMHSLKAEHPNVTLRIIGHQAQSEGQSVLPPKWAAGVHLTVLWFSDRV